MLSHLVASLDSCVYAHLDHHWAPIETLQQVISLLQPGQVTHCPFPDLVLAHWQGWDWLQLLACYCLPAFQMFQQMLQLPSQLDCLCPLVAPLLGAMLIP